MIRNPAGQTLRGLPQQGGAGASKNQESSRVPGPIHQHAQNGKQLLAALDFIDDDQAAQGFESELGVGKLSLVGGILKVEDGNRTTGILDEKAGQRGLPTWRAPTIATTGKSSSKARRVVSCLVRSITRAMILEKQ